jgi:hypothetical protein
LWKTLKFTPYLLVIARKRAHTGLMKLRLALLSCALIQITFVPQAHAVDPVKSDGLAISAPGDMDLTCNEISKEAEKMQGLIADVNLDVDQTEMQGHGITAATGIGGFLIGTVTGGIGFAAVGLLASEAIDADIEKSEDVKDKAAQRRSFLVGIYQAKECEGPIEHVLQDTSDQKLADMKPAAGQLGNREFKYND